MVIVCLNLPWILFFGIIPEILDIFIANKIHFEENEMTKKFQSAITEKIEESGKREIRLNLKMNVLSMVSL